MRLSSICASRWLDGGRIPLNSPIVLRTFKGKSTYIARCKYTHVDSQHDRGVKVFQTALKKLVVPANKWTALVYTVSAASKKALLERRGGRWPRILACQHHVPLFCALSVHQ